jgi:glutamate carboxypeptidase
VLEPSEKGALKLARKGCSTYAVTVKGRASHAGLDPSAGRNALVEVAHQVLEITTLGEGQTSVTPTIARVGTASNTVPALGTLLVDARVPSMEERQRIDDAMMSLRPHIDDVTITVERTTGHPPMPRSASEELFERARKVAASIGLPDLDGVEVGGASDGNFTAAAGCPTLDGLGPVGGGAHAEGEHVVVDKMPERATLVAALISDLLNEGDA